ncbi:hypothetical protein HPP92_025751 [Vanilla planifolia]|uniref:Replication factor A C-terminal domain-containing protein n=1 Tax=Vanilla planifolia TaxID=51239 RepID=A0A835UAH2_VANPL|nr:hypothetical protein HPP92_025751 [Vanilla planifolia]
MENVGGGSNSNLRDKILEPPFCSIVEVDTTSFSYLACSTCERPLPVDSPICRFCSKKCAFPAASKRLYRLLLSVATSETVLPVVCFDRAARVLIGCSADELFDFCTSHSSAAEMMGEIMEGEMLQMTLCETKKGNGKHLRVVSVVPLRTGFRPTIHTLRTLYGADGSHRTST